MRLLFLLPICWAVAVAGLAVAQDAPLTAAEKQLLQERARALHDKASALRQEAESGFVADNKACWDKVLVSSCQEEARNTKIDRMAAARRIDQEARELEQRLRRRNLAEREARMAEELPRREAEAAAQAEKNRQAQQEATAHVEKKRLEAEQRDKR